MHKLKIFLMCILLSVLVACGGTQQIPENNNNDENVLPAEDGNDTNNTVDENNVEENELGEDTEIDEEEDLEVQVAEYRINEKTWTVDPIENANEKVALLTFDDAPDKYALEMAKTLQELEANAIFFVNGHFLETEENQEILKEIYEMRFMIGNHTYTHKNLKDLSNEEQYSEIVRVNDLVEDITGERPKFFRAPFGVYTDYSKEIIQEENMVHMNWTYGYDWEKDYMTHEAIADIMVN